MLCGGVLGWVVGWLVAEMMIPSAPFCLPSVSLFEEGLQTGMYPPRVPSEGSDKNLTKHSPKETKESKTNVKRSKTKWRRLPMLGHLHQYITLVSPCRLPCVSIWLPADLLRLPCVALQCLPSSPLLEGGMAKRLAPARDPSEGKKHGKTTKRTVLFPLCAPSSPFFEGSEGGRGTGGGGRSGEGCKIACIQQGLRGQGHEKKTHRQRETRQSDTAVKRSETFWRRSPKSGSGPATPTCCRLYREETTSRPRRQELHRGVGAIWLGWWCVVVSVQ